ncbi:hypothetical protein [Burkholderia ubonensis]|uniref:hypothetical protein n=1 Tax=Burkholderia ubonensis TaxID=101571 RepID=UPI0007536788|nr:hypothetical protein [Burkholderia ubonensis]KVD47064.1 hypothetical protein WI86_17675 [Burkholderia ubonensis]KVU26597.1 hypothetical protein WK64_25510 [Burkholderia ubonensis]
MTTTNNSRADALTEYAGNVNRLIGGLWIERAVDGRGELERLLRDVRESTSMHLAAPAVEQPAAAPEPCAHEYARADRVCTECGEKATAFFSKALGAGGSSPWMTQNETRAEGSTDDSWIDTETKRQFAHLDTAPAQAAKLAAIPAGWKLVPIQPSGMMKDAGHSSLPVGVGGPWTAAAVYQAMIDNAPPPPAQANADDSEGAQ